MWHLKLSDNSLRDLKIQMIYRIKLSKNIITENAEKVRTVVPRDVKMKVRETHTGLATGGGGREALNLIISKCIVLEDRTDSCCC